MAVLFAGRVYIFEFKVRDLDQTQAKPWPSFRLKVMPSDAAVNAGCCVYVPIETDENEIVRI